MITCEIHIMEWGGSLNGSFRETSPNSAKSRKSVRRDTNLDYEKGWKDLKAYLPAALAEGKKPKKKKNKPSYVKYKLGYIGSILSVLALTFALPFVLLISTGLDTNSAVLVSAAIYLCTGLASTLLICSFIRQAEKTYKNERGRNYYHEHHREDIPPSHDDGKNELRTIASIVSSVDNIKEKSNNCTERKFADAWQQAAEFARTTQKYIVLSYWDNHEEQISKGFDSIVMRTSAAWTAYLDLLDDQQLTEEQLDMAHEKIVTVLKHGQKVAYRNFSRIDADIHGEEHIFDSPDVPKTLSNMEKLNIAAALAEDDE